MSDLRDTARKMIKLIIRANNSQFKAPVLEELRIVYGAQGLCSNYTAGRFELYNKEEK